MAGSVLLRHAGAGASRLFATTATATSPAARTVLAGGEGAWVRLMSTSAASQVKDEAAKAAAKSSAAAEAAKGDGEKKEVAISSYWGIEQSKKLVREDGTEWKWSCFRVRALCLLCSAPLCPALLWFSRLGPVTGGGSPDRSVCAVDGRYYKLLVAPCVID